MLGQKSKTVDQNLNFLYSIETVCEVFENLYIGFRFFQTIVNNPALTD
jgi:hypothetical protein